jgi:hypothetical protein
MLLALPLLAATARSAQATGAATLAAAWQQGDQAFVGLLRAAGSMFSPGPRLALPTRAHGLWVQPEGAVVAFARRPGDWLLRWHPVTNEAQWVWQDDDQRLNGHGLLLPDRGPLLTSQTDRGTGAGWLAVRDRHTLAPVDHWPTHGHDPHQLLRLPRALGPLPAGTMLVANGGIRTRPETGRSRPAGLPMDASLVALDPDRGRLLGRWCLNDPQLSIRHLAWNERAGRVGVALQAEHAEPQARATAPVLAVWDGRALQPARHQPALQGYGGDIAALGPGFVVSCTRAGVLALFDAEGRWQVSLPHSEACALASARDGVWAAGDRWMQSLGDPGPGIASTRPDASLDLGEGLVIDNHWVPWRVCADAGANAVAKGSTPAGLLLAGFSGRPQAVDSPSMEAIKRR